MKLNPRNPAATYGLAQRLIAIGDEVGAADALRRFDAAQSATRGDRAASQLPAAPFVRVGLLRQSPESPVLFAPAAYVKAFSLLANGALDEAVADFRTIDAPLAAAAGPSGTHYQLAQRYQSLGRNSDAVRELERAAVDPPVVGQDHFYDMLGVLYTSDADLDGALTAYRKRVLANPNHSDAHRKLAQIYLELGRHDEASAEFTASLLLDPMNAEAYAGRAQIRLRLGDYADAAKWARAALMLNRTHAAAQYTLGASLIRLGRADDGNAALEEFRRLQAAAQAAANQDWALKLIRQSAQARIDAGDFSEAAALLQQVVSRQPDVAINHVNLGDRPRTRGPLRGRDRCLPPGGGAERRRKRKRPWTSRGGVRRIGPRAGKPGGAGARRSRESESIPGRGPGR